jgi:acyl-[acyl-carrier-protein]-phospholipid O-acyltransferase/long-chain-fatty-acid--[acyl-carrier-protein] ligase
VDPETLESLPIGVDGLILIAGTQVMLGYLNEPEKTAEVLVEIGGRYWYKSGDKGHLDEDGFLTIVDRYSRFAKIGGEMVSLAAVENAIYSVIDDDSVECIAMNIADGKKGERIMLIYTGNIDSEDFRHKMLSSNVLALLLPAEYIHVDNLPKLGSGKTDLVLARRIAIEALVEIG